AVVSAANLKVLTAENVEITMQNITFALGLRCIRLVARHQAQKGEGSHDARKPFQPGFLGSLGELNSNSNFPSIIFKCASGQIPGEFLGVDLSAPKESSSSIIELARSYNLNAEGLQSAG